MFDTGDIISFRYTKITATDKTPMIVVLAPLYEGHVHGINIRYLPAGSERRLLVALTDEELRKTKEMQLELNRVPLLKRLLETDDINNALKIPQAFYERYIKLILRTNAYRKYKPAFMSNISKVYDKRRALVAMRRI